MKLFTSENFFIEEMKTLIRFIKKPNISFVEKRFSFKFKRFFVIFILDIIFLLFATLIFYFIAFIGFEDIFKKNFSLLLFENFSLLIIVILIIFIVPVIEELLYRFHLIYRNKIISFFIPILFLLFSFLTYNHILGTLGFILLISLFFVGYKKNETEDLKNVWNKKFKLIFYSTTFFLHLVI